MSILAIRSKQHTNEMRFVGVYHSSQVVSYLALYCSAFTTSKTEIMQTLLKNWVDSQELTEEALINAVSDRAKKAWRGAREKHPTFSFDVFSGQLKRELLDKGINADQVQKIIKQICNGKN